MPICPLKPGTYCEPTLRLENEGKCICPELHPGNEIELVIFERRARHRGVAMVEVEG